MVLNGIPISDEECIGDSLATINSAFQTLSANVESLNTTSTNISAFNVFDSPTIDLNWNASTRTLSAVTTASVATSSSPMVAKAWVNFNGTTSPGTIRSSYNVSSVTKNGTGDYTVNFLTVMADVNYSVAGMSRNNHVGSTDPNTGYGASICISRTTDPTINAVRIWNVGLVSTGAAANVVSLQDPTTIGITIFGN